MSEPPKPLPTPPPVLPHARSRTATHPGGCAQGTSVIPRVHAPADPTALLADGVLSWVRSNVFGTDLVVPGPYGPHPRRYFDYTASGLPFRPIEELLQKQVLPFMSSTHSRSSYAAELIARYVKEAYGKVRRAMRGTEEDIIVFTGSGTTGAVNKLITILGLRISELLQQRFKLDAQIPPEARPIVILTRMEHHSNDLPWRETIADIEYIGYDESGRASWRAIDRILSSPEYRERPLKIGTFTAASNVTGVLNETEELAAAMHAHGGLAFFDFAAAGPYVPIDLHPEDNPAYRKDAVFVSMHKFTGGPQCPGVLVANRKLFAGRAPAEPGGGTVLYTSPWEYRYVDDLEQREESGTPAIVSIIRAGLAFDLKSALGDRLQRLEDCCVAVAVAAWRDNPRIAILGPDPLTVPRLGILSLILDDGRLHHNLAVRLLNDLYGIQIRGGCMCAGTYGHDLLGIDEPTSRSIRNALDQGNFAVKPGWIRVSFGPGVSPEDLAVLLEAIPHIAEHWRDYAGDYVMDPETAEWRHRDEAVPTGELRLQLPEALQPPGRATR